MHFTPNKFNKKWLGRITLLLLLTLFVLKLTVLSCSIWLCLGFVALIVAYSVIIDFFGDSP